MGVEVRITRRVRLGGRYWAAASHEATLEIGDASRQVFEVPGGEHVVRVTAYVPFPTELKVTVVGEDTLDPPRPFLVEPPLDAPPAVRAIAGR